MLNVFTIDLEEWFHANYQEDLFDHERTYEVRVVENTQRLLDLFDRYGAKATFFTLGWVAEQHPELIRTIAERGHEIATHGYGHQLIYHLTPEQFREDLRRSISLIEQAAPVKIRGYRAPSWSLTERSTWAWEILQELGLRYDSSAFPIRTFLYGMPDAPRFPHHPRAQGKPLELWELPPSTIRFGGKNFPFSGGFYFRLLPYWLIRWCLRRLNRQHQPAILYLHPREIDPQQPRLPLKPLAHFIHYVGVRSCERKLARLLKEFRFTSIERLFLKENLDA